MPDFLLEIGCEEIPARMLDGAREELARRVGDLLVRERLARPAQVEAYSTPRRLSCLARQIAPKQPDIEEQVLGPSVKVAYKDGQPTPAAQSFAKKVELDLSKLQRVSTPKGEYLAAMLRRKGRSTSDVLSETLAKEIGGLYWVKSMYWRGKSAERFVRPVRWMVALLDNDVVPVEFGGIRASNVTHGHRVLGHAVMGSRRLRESAAPVAIQQSAAYSQVLRSVAVICDPEERTQQTRKALDAAARTVPGLRWRDDAELLNTVVNLTEFPSAILGAFDAEFLSLPEEVLVTVMRDHQKYFALEDGSGRLAPYFLAVLNTDGDPQGLIRHGNERVLRARFNDARFFWHTDQRIPLKQRVEKLKSVTFQKDLGSYYAKAQRLSRLCMELAKQVEAAGVQVNRSALHEAALLAKTDLTTELVKEFTELQGIVGGLYARAQGLDAAVADAIYDHYKPQSMEESVPRTTEGALLSIADKADSIAGMFGLGLQPTGSKDPFALRRQANGIIKTIAEHRLPLSIAWLFEEALASYKGSEGEKSFSAAEEIYKKMLGAAGASPAGSEAIPASARDNVLMLAISRFMIERLEFYLREVCGFAYDVVNAVLAAGGDDVVDTIARAEAVSQVRGSEDFESISIAFKRMKNILRQSGEEAKLPSGAVPQASSGEEAERNLADASARTAEAVRRLREQGNYQQALIEISKLRPVVDTFFDKIMVMVDDERIRTARLGLLSSIVTEFSTIADFSEIVIEGKD